jgi:hypothetical protein
MNWHSSKLCRQTSDTASAAAVGWTCCCGRVAYTAVECVGNAKRKAFASELLKVTCGGVIWYEYLPESIGLEARGDVLCFFCVGGVYFD